MCSIKKRYFYYFYFFNSVIAVQNCKTEAKYMFCNAKCLNPFMAKCVCVMKPVEKEHAYSRLCISCEKNVLHISHFVSSRRVHRVSGSQESDKENCYYCHSLHTRSLTLFS